MEYKKVSKILGALVLSCLLISCSSGPTQQQVDNADYGDDMSPAECTAAVERVIMARLKDPESVRFRHQTCYQSYWESGVGANFGLKGNGVMFGWIQHGEVNAKNSFGGYTGFQPYKMMLRNGRVVP